MKKIVALICLIAFVSCVNKQNKEEKMNPMMKESIVQSDTTSITQDSFFFSGDYYEANNVATFKDCITGQIVPIAQEGAYKEIQKEYKYIDIKDKEGLYCTVMGYMINKPLTEFGAPNQLVITSLIKFYRTAACHTGIITDASYTGTIQDSIPRKVILTLQPDYTFNTVVIDLKTEKQLNSIHGKWNRTSDENIVFLTDDEVLYEGTLDFTNQDLKLYNNNELLIIFKKESSEFK